MNKNRNKSEFPVWKTLEYLDKNALQSFLIDLTDVNNSSFLGPTLGLFIGYLSVKKEVIPLYLVTPRELGLREYSSYQELCQSAFNRGLKLCPVETFFQLYRKNLVNEREIYLCIASEPLSLGDGEQEYIFRLEKVPGNPMDMNVEKVNGENDLIYDLTKFVFC